MISICDDELAVVKQRFAAAIGARETQMLEGCIICSPKCQKCSPLYYSSAGAKEHALSSICEFCYDDFGRTSSSPYLTPDGAMILRVWFVLCKCKTVLRVEEQLGRMLRAVAAGAYSFPTLWARPHEQDERSAPEHRWKKGRVERNRHRSRSGYALATLLRTDKGGHAPVNAGLDSTAWKIDQVWVRASGLRIWV